MKRSAQNYDTGRPAFSGRRHRESSHKARRIRSVALASSGIACMLCVLAGCGPGPEAASGDPAEALQLTLENIHRSGGGATDVRVSPDGERLAIVASGAEAGGIHLLSMADAEAPARSWRAGSSPIWSPDSRSIAFLDGGDLWIARTDADAAPMQITRGAGGIRDAAFSPDRAHIAFYSTDSGSQDIWIAASDGSSPPRQLTSAAMALDDSRFEPAWSPDGRRIAYISNASDYWHDDVWIVDVESGASRQLTRSVMASSSPVWSPDGTRIVLFATSKDGYWYQDLADIWTVDPERPGSERVLPMQVFASDNAMRHRPYFSGDGSNLYFPYIERGRYDIWAVPAAGGVATRMTNLGGSLRSYHVAGDVIALVRTGPVEGAEVYTQSGSGGPAVRRTQFSPNWAGIQPPEEIAYRTFDSMYIQGFLYLPPEVGQGMTCPALVQVHGGGTNSYSNGLNLTEQYLASKGFVVLAINYRGGSGFGRAFQDLAVGDWMGGQALDAGAAADYLRTLPYVNGRVGIYGGSYGGAMSMAAATLTPEKFDAAVPTRGAYSEEGRFDETDRLGQIFTKTGHLGMPEENPAAYETSNSLARLDRLTAPILLMHGEEDRRVPFTHHRLAVAELERLGKVYEEKSYPGEGHGFRDPANRIDLDQRREDFFNRHLGACASS